jgi:hypothetical protein
LAGLAALTGVFVHGYIGHRVLLTPLTTERLFATRSFGDEQMTWRVLVVSWHVVTATFFCSGMALVLMALGRLDAPGLPRFLSVLHASFVMVAFGILGTRLFGVIGKPIPIAFTICMSTASIGAWLG